MTALAIVSPPQTSQQQRTLLSALKNLLRGLMGSKNAWNAKIKVGKKTAIKPIQDNIFARSEHGGGGEGGGGHLGGVVGGSMGGMDGMGGMGGMGGGGMGLHTSMAVPAGPSCSWPNISLNKHLPNKEGPGVGR